MSTIVFYIVTSFWYLVSRLPFRVLYFFSDLMYYLVFYVVRYRRKVVHKNLVSSFPEKSESEIKEIEHKFYHRLCDYFVETMKLYGMSEEKVRKRLQFTGLDKVHEVLERGQSIVLYFSHTFNWEYAVSLPLHIKHDNLAIAYIYHPLRNRRFDEFFKKIRCQYKAENVAMKVTLRHVVQYQKQNKQFLLGTMADQSPKWEAIHHWLNFFNQDTPVFTGSEKIAAKTGCAVFFLRMERVRRSKYTAEFVHMTDNAAELPEMELTNQYFRLLEDCIKEHPESWLWTHDRWKRTREGLKQREERLAKEREEKQKEKEQ